MSETVYFTTLAIAFGTIILIFGMRYYAALQKSKVRLDADEAARLRFEALEASMNDVKTRLNAIEKILKDVE